MKIFVVMETGFEYNDNYYYETENGGGAAVVGFKSREKADAECLHRNIQAIMGMEFLNEYNWEDASYDYGQLREIAKYQVDSTRLDLNEEQATEIHKIVGNHFFTVVELSVKDLPDVEPAPPVDGNADNRFELDLE